MVDRLEIMQAQEFCQLAGINPITLITVFEQSVLTRIADQHFGDVGLKQIIQPGRPGSFFEGDRQSSA